MNRLICFIAFLLAVLIGCGPADESAGVTALSSDPESAWAKRNADPCSKCEGTETSTASEGRCDDDDDDDDDCDDDERDDCHDDDDCDDDERDDDCDDCDDRDDDDCDDDDCDDDDCDERCRSDAGADDDCDDDEDDCDDDEDDCIDAGLRADSGVYPPDAGVRVDVGSF